MYAVNFFNDDTRPQAQQICPDIIEKQQERYDQNMNTWNPNSNMNNTAYGSQLINTGACNNPRGSSNIVSNNAEISNNQTINGNNIHLPINNQPAQQNFLYVRHPQVQHPQADHPQVQHMIHQQPANVPNGHDSQPQYEMRQWLSNVPNGHDAQPQYEMHQRPSNVPNWHHSQPQHWMRQRPANFS